MTVCIDSISIRHIWWANSFGSTLNSPTFGQIKLLFANFVWLFLLKNLNITLKKRKNFKRHSIILVEISVKFRKNDKLNYLHRVWVAVGPPPPPSSHLQLHDLILEVSKSDEVRGAFCWSVDIVCHFLAKNLRANRYRSNFAEKTEHEWSTGHLCFLTWKWSEISGKIPGKRPENFGNK